MRSAAVKWFFDEPPVLCRASTETRLLLLCARTSPEPGRSKELAQHDLDWERVLESAARHGVASLVYWNRQNSIEERQVGDRHLESFQAVCYWHSVHNDDLYERLRDILKLFAQERIPVVVLKGAALAALIYPRLTLRSMGDIDILVPKAPVPGFVWLATRGSEFCVTLRKP